MQQTLAPYKAANANELPPPVNDNNADLFSQNISYDNPATQTGATPLVQGILNQYLRVPKTGGLASNFVAMHTINGVSRRAKTAVKY
jgi:hypothetical protein